MTDARASYTGGDDDNSAVYRFTQINFEEDNLEFAICKGVSTVTNTPIQELPILFDSIDPESLNRVVQSGSSITVSFVYSDCEITVSNDGAIGISPVDSYSVKQNSP